MVFRSNHGGEESSDDRSTDEQNTGLLEVGVNRVN
jgi:hypothetical protein